MFVLLFIYVAIYVSPDRITTAGPYEPGCHTSANSLMTAGTHDRSRSHTLMSLLRVITNDSSKIGHVGSNVKVVA